MTIPCLPSDILFTIIGKDQAVSAESHEIGVAKPSSDGPLWFPLLLFCCLFFFFFGGGRQLAIIFRMISGLQPKLFVKGTYVVFVWRSDRLLLIVHETSTDFLSQGKYRNTEEHLVMRDQLAGYLTTGHHPQVNLNEESLKNCPPFCSFCHVLKDINHITAHKSATNYEIFHATTNVAEIDTTMSNVCFFEMESMWIASTIFILGRGRKRKYKLELRKRVSSLHHCMGWCNMSRYVLPLSWAQKLLSTVKLAKGIGNQVEVI